MKTISKVKGVRKVKSEVKNIPSRKGKEDINFSIGLESRKKGSSKRARFYNAIESLVSKGKITSKPKEYKVKDLIEIKDYVATSLLPKVRKDISLTLKKNITIKSSKAKFVEGKTDRLTEAVEIYLNK